MENVDDDTVQEEYLELDRQLDQLDAYLTVLENRGDKLQEDAKQLLREVRRHKEEGAQTPEENGEQAEQK